MTTRSHTLNAAQMARIESMRSNGATVDTEPIDGYPGWVSVTVWSPRRNAYRGFFALIPEDGGKITRMADWLD